MSPRAPPTLTSVRGVLAGHATDRKESTGATVVLFPRGARGAVEVRGGAPGTYHTDGLGAMGSMGMVGALFFAGGSLYGLDAARGVRRFVLSSGGGTRLWGSHPKLVRITGAVVFDLPRDHPLRADYDELGYRAALAASRKPLEPGLVGAGTGTAVGKLNGREFSMKGGIGTSAVAVPGGHTLGALVVMNAVGSVVDPATGAVIAGTRSREGKGWATREEILSRWTRARRATDDRGTVLVTVATDLAVTRWELARMARAANDAVARCVVPAHMATDGDFAVAVTTDLRGPQWPGGEERPYPGALADLLGLLTEEAVTNAITQSVRVSNPAP